MKIYHDEENYVYYFAITPTNIISIGYIPTGEERPCYMDVNSIVTSIPDSASLDETVDLDVLYKDMTRLADFCKTDLMHDECECGRNFQLIADSIILQT